MTITIGAGCEGMRVLVAGIEPGSTEVGDDVQLLPAVVARGEHGTEEHVGRVTLGWDQPERTSVLLDSPSTSALAPW